MKNKQILLINSLLNSHYEIREEEVEGVKYIVVPTVMMLPGVHNGSAGAVLHTAEGLTECVPGWNGIPVTLYHPENEKQEFISANQPSIPVLGRVFNSKWDDNKLKAEVWFYADKLAENTELYQAIQNGLAIDVSLGMFHEKIMETGVYNDETYEMIAQQYVPDHLAILPGQEGACSWGDGCGIRANNKKKESIMKEIKAMQKQGIYPTSIILHEQSLTNKLDSIRNLVYADDREGFYRYVREVFEDKVIYSQEETGQPSKLYQRSFIFNTEGVAEWDGDPIEVREEKKYIKISTNKKGEKNMENSKPCCEDKVLALIANEKSKFTDDDKDWLMTLDAVTLNKLEPDSEKPQNVNAKPTLTKEGAVDYLKQELKTDEDWLDIVPENIALNAKAEATRKKEYREKLVEKLTANNVYEADELKDLSDGILEKMAKVLETDDESIDYTLSGANGAVVDDDLLLPVEYLKK